MAAGGANTRPSAGACGERGAGRAARAAHAPFLRISAQGGGLVAPTGSKGALVATQGGGACHLLGRRLQAPCCGRSHVHATKTHEIGAMRPRAAPGRGRCSRSTAGAATHHGGGLLLRRSPNRTPGRGRGRRGSGPSGAAHTAAAAAGRAPPRGVARRAPRSRRRAQQAAHRVRVGGAAALPCTRVAASSQRRPAAAVRPCSSRSDPPQRRRRCDQARDLSGAVCPGTRRQGTRATVSPWQGGLQQACLPGEGAAVRRPAPRRVALGRERRRFAK